MATMTLEIAEDLKKEIEELKVIDWSKIAREAIEKKVGQLRILNAIAAKSKLTDEEALELGRTINRSIHARFKKEHPGAYA